MAEEKITPEITDLGMDDMSALSFVLQQVKGVGLVSSNRLDTAPDDETQVA